MQRTRNIVCAVSGGVDSAISACILKKQGFNVQGVFMTNWDITNETGQCTADKDREHAENVCNFVGIPFRDVNFVKEYWNDVFSQFIDGLGSGITPNPDVLCNQHVKFGHFFHYATHTLGADAVATGHYARSSAGKFLENVDAETGVKLLTAVDQTKDQTLFLSQISQQALRRTMFPVGDMRKIHVKEMAREFGLDKVIQKKESKGICFIGKRQFENFIEEYMAPTPGKFIDLQTGEIVGRHKGVHCLTIGQRALISGQHQAYFVAKKDISSQTIYVVPGTDHPGLYSLSLETCLPHWINCAPDRLNNHSRLRCEYRFQHLHPSRPCAIQLRETGCLHVTFEKPQRAIIPGQYIVFYIGEECLGSGVIKQSGPSLITNKEDYVNQNIKDSNTQYVNIGAYHRSDNG